MRIISKFKDYYDSGLAYGIDDDIVYVRETKANDQDASSYSALAGDKHVICNMHTIFFCDKAYRYAEIDGHHLYSLEDVDRVVLKLPKETQDVYFADWESLPRHIRAKYNYRSSMRRSTFGEWFFHEDYLRPKKYWHRQPTDPSWVQKQAKKECDMSGCPVILADNTRRVYNPVLKQYEFIRVKDPFTAFQELTAWFSNRANTQEKIPAISNSDMIISKGFDIKTSFRKDKRA